MGWHDLILRLRALLRRRHAESELDEELDFHIEMETRKNLAAGMAAVEARLNAGVRFGGVTQVREECRDVRGLVFLESLVRDLRWSGRALRKAPLFTAVAAASLAIGIGANTAVFSLIDTVLLRMLPVRNPEQLVVTRWGAHSDLRITTTWATSDRDGSGRQRRNVFSWAVFTALRAHSRNLNEVMGFSPLGPVNVATGGPALATGAMVASGNYFQALGVGTVIGRTFTTDDESVSGFPPAVLSYRFWDRAFGLDPAAIGKTLYVNGQACIVIGVTPKEFFGVSAGGFWRTPIVDITLPIRWREQLEGSGHRQIEWFGNDLFWVQAIGRLRSSGASAAAKSEWSALIAANLPESARRQLGSEAARVYLDPGGQGLDDLRRVYRRPLLILMAVVALTLLMACANLAGLLLARATARQREIMVRLSVGASRGRLVRQLLLEGAVLAAIGATVGMAFAWWGVRVLVSLVSSGSAPIPVEAAPDLRILGFTLGVSLLTTLVFALAPAVRATRVDVAGGLREDATLAPGMRSLTMGRILLAVQVAVALLLLVGATLFTRSLANVRSLPLGFNPHQLVLFNLAPGKNRYNETRGSQLYARLRERLKQMPGVTGVSLSAERLIGGSVASGPISLPRREGRRDVAAEFNFVGPDFVDVMQIPVILGRGVEARDMPAAPRVAVINETLAREFTNGSPIGKTFRWGNELDVEVIGIVKDAKYSRLREDMPPTVYAPYTQRPFGWPQEMAFEVRIAGSVGTSVARIRAAVADVDRTMPLTQVSTQDAQIDDSLAQERLFASLVSLFSGIALVLACVGIYGSVAYNVTQRTRELGIRMALGANRLKVMRMLLGQTAVTILGGFAIGVPATWALTRVIESQLYGIRPHDPVSLIMASVAVVGVAFLAALVPARRAMRIDPVRALRYE